MYFDIRVTFPVKSSDVCVGGYEMDMAGELVNFDFEYFEGCIDKEDPWLLHVLCVDPDYETFPVVKSITEQHLSNINDITEFIVDAESQDGTINTPIAIESLSFVLPYDEWKQFDVAQDVLQKIQFNGSSVDEL